MMIKFIKTGSLMLAFLFVVGTAQAQKFGYVNSGEILTGMPAVKQMQSNLEGFGKILEKEIQQMVTDFQAKQQKASQEEQAGNLSPAAKDALLKELQGKEQEILKYQRESQQKLAEKEQELLQPILDKVNTAITDVAKEDGYQFIFDLQSGVLLYYKAESDVTAKVKAKLGL
jgi:outer membrane protein